MPERNPIKFRRNDMEFGYFYPNIKIPSKTVGSFHKDG